MTLFATIHAPSLPPDLAQRIASRFPNATIAGETLTIERDPFGVQPLYYAHVDGALVVTNALSAIKRVVSRELNRDAIADFLAYGYNTNVETTTFAAIRRVPPAHRLIATRDSMRLERWWQLPFREQPLRISVRDAVAQFDELLRRAVEKRAAGRIAISLSGGIDSVSVGAHLRGRATALTSVWDPIIPDVEREWAALAARSLELPHEIHECVTYTPFARFDDPAVRGEEPHDEPFRASFIDFLRRCAAHGEILMTGQGGDPALYASHDHFWRLLRKVKLLTFVRDAAGFAITRRRRPPLLLRSRLLRRKRAPRVMPPWLDTPFAREMHLAERFATISPRTDTRVHPWRDDAYRLLSSPSWPCTFESFHEGVTGVPVELATPWLDAGLLEFLFALPPMPFFADKDIARQALRGRVPEELRRRPKTPLRGDPLASIFRTHVRQWIGFVREVPELEEFVDRRSLCMNMEEMGSNAEALAAAVSLALWLRGERSQ